MADITSTRISRDAAVFVVVDIQHRLAAAMERRDQVVATAGKLVRAAAVLGVPVIVTRQNPDGLGGTVEELEGILFDTARDGAQVLGVDKMAFCCAVEHDFREALLSSGRKQVVLLGMETHICIAQTALALNEEGYQVHVVADGCCSRSMEHHLVALDRLRQAGVIVTVSESVMYEAVGRAGTDEFRRLLAVVKS